MKSSLGNLQGRGSVQGEGFKGKPSSCCSPGKRADERGREETLFVLTVLSQKGRAPLLPLQNSCTAAITLVLDREDSLEALRFLRLEGSAGLIGCIFSCYRSKAQGIISPC